MTTNPPLDPQYKTPGQLIESLLDNLGWSKRVLAIVLGVSETTMNKVISAKQPVDAKMALALSDVLGIPAETFLELQKTWDLAQARLLDRPDPGRTNRAHLFGNLPVSEMIKRGWLDATDIKQVPEVEAALTKFFGSSSAEEIEFLPHAAKKTEVNADVTPTQLAWLYRVKQMAEDMLVSKFSTASLDAAIAKLSRLLAAPSEIRQVSRILSEAGVRYLIVESLPGAKIDGVCFWLNDSSPVIAMSLRYDRIDNFWFVLRHELEHVRQGHGRVAAILDAELEGDRAGTGANVPQEERIANQAAAEFCVPAKQIKAFVERKAPFFAERDLIGFARTIQVHPGLVAGQLQHITKTYNRFRNHLVKIREVATTPGTMVDGWGTVAPVGE